MRAGCIPRKIACTLLEARRRPVDSAMLKIPRFRLKTKLVLAITGMVFTLVVALSFVYISQLLHQRINESYANADFIAHEVLEGTRQALELDVSGTRVDLRNNAQVHDVIAQILQSDAPLNSLLQSVVGYNPEVYDVSIADAGDHALLHTDASLLGKTLPIRPSLQTLRTGSFFQQIATVYGAPRVYEVRLPIQRDGTPFGEIRVGLSTIFIKSELQPMLNRALLFSVIALFVSIGLAALLSSFALRPLEAIGRRLDAMTAEGETPPPESTSGTDEYGVVNTKIDRLGRQFRDVKEVFSALKENLDQIMGALQDGIVLFTRDARVVLVSASAERFTGKPRSEMLGSHVEQIFNDSTRLGQIVLYSFALQQDVPPREIETLDGRRMQMSLDFIEERGQPIGALLSMRDVESVRRIENELELSRRLAAIGRLTSGVAHEVKNPINSIVIHLEVLREKLLQLDPESRRHMDIITSEIHRLDRVVKTLVDFTRPVELALSELDLRRIAEEVFALAAPQARQQNVEISYVASTEPLVVRADSDLMKQALLNVVLNGIQAMPQGGKLIVSSARQNDLALIVVRDHGVGIPPEVRDKIFNLYFTTKKSGSGIGLAMTYRALQLHNGALEFDSEIDRGTTFRLLLPLAITARAEGTPADENSTRTE